MSCYRARDSLESLGGPGSPVLPDRSGWGWSGLCWVCFGTSLSALSQQIPSSYHPGPKGLPWWGEKSWLGDNFPRGIGEQSSPVEAGVTSHSQDRWEPPSVDQHQAGSDGDTDRDREKASVCCREDLAAVSLAALFVKVYKAQNSAHPRLGTEVWNNHQLEYG